MQQEGPSSQDVSSSPRICDDFVEWDSELRIGENGKAYLAVVLDLFSRITPAA